MCLPCNERRGRGDTLPASSNFGTPTNQRASRLADAHQIAPVKHPPAPRRFFGECTIDCLVCGAQEPDFFPADVERRCVVVLLSPDHNSPPARNRSSQFFTTDRDPHPPDAITQSRNTATQALVSVVTGETPARSARKHASSETQRLHLSDRPCFDGAFEQQSNATIFRWEEESEVRISRGDGRSAAVSV